MSPVRDMAPTRMNLLRTSRRLERVEKGADLLHRKREALASELFQQARPAVDARQSIEQRAALAYPALLRALALHGQTDLRVFGWPTRDVQLSIEPGEVWGVAVSKIVAKPPISRTLGARGTAPAAVGPSAAEAAKEFELLADLLLEAAPREMLIRRLGDALAQTSRQVNTLERRIAPALRSQRSIIQFALEEREREEHLRMKLLLRRRAARGRSR